MSNNIRLLQLIKKYGVTVTVTLLVFLGGGVTLSECGGFVSIKMSDYANEFLVDKRNCKVPSDSEESEKSLEPDQLNDNTKEQPPID